MVAFFHSLFTSSSPSSATSSALRGFMLPFLSVLSTLPCLGLASVRGMRTE